MFSMKKYYLPILSVAALSLFTACDDDIDHGGFGGKNGRNTLSFGVGVCTPTTPRLSTRAIPLTSGEDGEEPLFLIESVTPMEELFFDAPCTPTTQSATRGTPVYSENFDKLVGSFWAVCYSSDCGKTGSGTDEAYTDDTFYDTGKHEFTGSAGTYSHTYDDEMHWPSDKTLHFFFEAPSQEKQLSSDNITRYTDGRIKFDYTMAATDAENQKDLLFGYLKLTMDMYDEKQKKDEAIEVPFHHALCAVKFNFTSNYNDKNAAKITKIEIQNVYSQGVCTVATDGKVTWTNVDGSEAVSSTYTGITPQTYIDNQGDGYDFPEQFYSETNLEVPTTTNSLNDKNFTHTFNLIPQARAAGDVTFVIHYTIGDDEAEKERTVSPAINWAAGNIYTYTLTINDAAVTVSEQTLGGALLTTNSGNVTEYQRVALAANWVTDNGDGSTTIVASQPLTTDWLTGLPSTEEANWRLGTDGYYYYKYPVQPGNAAVNSLYTSRNTVSAPDNHPDATLEFTVTVQAVRAANKDENGTEQYNGYTVWSSGLGTSFFSDQPE